MGDWVISAQDVITLAAIIAAAGGIYAFVSKPFKAMDELKKSVDNLTDSVTDMKDDVKMQGDMIYQLLDHASTNNNTGGMREALDKYNAYYRH